jgi:hypothetical protein
MPEVLKPSRGLLTFEAEGQENPGGAFHSRVFHVPTDSSGLTIGRGYDMKGKSKAQIVADLKSSGVAEADATKISGAAGLKGKAAKTFITDNKLEKFEISQQTQVKLFEITYAAEEAEVKRICAKADTVEAYGKVDWAKTSAAIRDLFVDLKYRGDYTTQSRKIVQKLLAKNDLAGLQTAMADEKNWTGVPADRFKRRRDFIKAAKP